MQKLPGPPEKRKARVSGVCALCRHDGTEWPRPASGTALRKKGVLLGIRGDWDFLHNQLSLPSWSSTRLCCWCEMEKDNLGRNESPPVLTSDQFFSWCLECGTDVAPLFSLPGRFFGGILVVYGSISCNLWRFCRCACLVVLLFWGSILGAFGGWFVDVLVRYLVDCLVL